MKKIYILLLSFSLITLNSIFGQSMKASIGPGPVAAGAVNVEIYLKALRPTAGAVTEQISTLELNVGIPTSAFTTPPTLTVASSIFGVAWSVEPPLSEGGFWNYHIYESALIPALPFTTDLETAVMELQLTGGAPLPILIPNNVSLVSLPDGGTTNAMAFILTGTISAVGTDLYYSRPSDQGYTTTATNAFSYRPTSVNSTTGDATSTATMVLGTTPVKFVGFSAIKKDNNAVLTWQIENESAITDRYEIERSLNGVDFKKAYTVLPKNNGKSSNSYELTDLNLTSIRSSGIFYYRIKQVDKDGRSVYTTIKSLRLNTKGGFALGVYPNPIKNIANVTIDLEQDATTLISLTDAGGKQVQVIQVKLFKGPNIKNINMEGLAAGSYLLKVQTPTEVQTIPVIKTN
ncbi:MAG: T9SS type A sorting domain-containing protein [Ferruginibacter sp.]